MKLHVSCFLISFNKVRPYSQSEAAPAVESSGAAHGTRHWLSYTSGQSFCSGHEICPTACEVKGEQQRKGDCTLSVFVWWCLLSNNCTWFHHWSGLKGRCRVGRNSKQMFYKVGFFIAKLVIVFISLVNPEQVSRTQLIKSYHIVSYCTISIHIFMWNWNMASIFCTVDICIQSDVFVEMSISSYATKCIKA